MRYRTTARNTYKPGRPLTNSPRYVRDPETGEMGELVSLRALLWQYARPAGMLLRLMAILASMGLFWFLVLGSRQGGAL